MPKLGEKVACMALLLLFLLAMKIVHSEPELYSITEHTIPSTNNDLDYQLYANILKDGLPKTAQPKKVIVVGAGIAGLTAAYILKNSGHQVTLVEASERIGGRIHTYRDEEYGWYADLGAMRIPSNHTLVNILIEKFDLPKNRFLMYNPNTFYSVNNVLERAYTVEDNIALLNYNLTAEELKLGSVDKIYAKAIQPILDAVDEHGWHYVVKKYGTYSIKTYLEQSGLISPGAIRMIGVLTNERSVFYTSILESIRDAKILNDQTIFHEIIGGTEKLPGAFLETLKDNIRLTSEVTEIDQRDNTVYVKYKSNRGVKNFDENDARTIAGDYCIMTATTKAALLIKYTPVLSQAKMDALEELHYDQSTKIFLYFSKPFWLDDGIFGGKSITDGVSRFIYYPNHNLTDGGIILASYTWGDDAVFWLSLTDEQCKQKALETLSHIHQRDLTKYYVNGIVKKWSEDPYSHGAYSLFQPTQEDELYVSLYKPENKIFFAGEHTTLNHAWIEGAIASGIRAVVQIAIDTYDIAIVGGGPIGLAAALFAAKEGKNVVVLEKYSFKNKYGSSNGRTRQFREMYADELLAEYARVSVKYWKTIEDWSGERLLYQNGFLFFGDQDSGNTTEGNFKDIIKICKKLKLGCESISNRNLSHRFNFTNIPHSWNGLFHQASGEIDVEKTIDALLGLLKKFNVTLLEGTVVDNITVHNDNIQLKSKTNFIHAKKVILAPGPYAHRIFKHLGFQINMDIWEMSSFYYKIRKGFNYPTWFAFAGGSQNLYYGFPESKWERPGYVRVSPDFVTKVIKDPSERTNQPDVKSFFKTTEFVKNYMPNVMWYDHIIENSTCLATSVRDGGFILDFAPPNIVPNNDDIIIFAAGWGFKFVPLFGKILADLAVKGSTAYNITAFNITRPGVISLVKESTYHNSSVLCDKKDNRAVCASVVIVLCVFLAVILIAIIIRICYNYCRHRTYENLDKVAIKTTKL